MTVQSLWIGPRLSAIERLAITSFLAHGHAYHLYCYDDIDNVPAGAVLKDGRSVLPADAVFGYSDGFAKGSPAAFSNLFRYALLIQHGGWWVDTDVVCLRPFDFPQARVLGSELTDNPPNVTFVSTSVIKAPAGDALMQWAWNQCGQLDPTRVRFGEMGPRMLQQGVDTLGVQGDVLPPACFSPVHSFEWRSIISDDRRLPSDAYGLHLWTQMWHANGIDPNGRFSGNSIFELLKRRYSVV